MTSQLDPERWQRVTSLFNRASALMPEKRAAFLDEETGGDATLRDEVESLLAFDHGEGAALASGIRGAVVDVVSSIGRTTRIGEPFGPYRLQKEIGCGGMGTVYLAERQDDFQQRVAIKFVRGFLGSEAVRRFRAERQILASLEHPGIARLLDGGTTADGAPYLVMEYVDGVPIDQYCNDHALATRQRVELFCRVCDAVSHAHRSLVVHRDLKPSNIFVTADGDPKLLDFGIAKLLENGPGAPGALETTPTLQLMTPHYASPEQIRGEAITTATDVYSLGAMLFELLTGARPFEMGSLRREEIERIVCGQEPPKPSSVAETRRARELRGDLDTIVLAALAKEPGRRLASVDHLAADLRRFLDGFPVLARPSTIGYRVGRFVRRHRVGVATAAVFVLTVSGLATALAVSAAQARQERNSAERVTEMLIQMFSGSDPRTLRGNSITARELLDNGAEQIRTKLRDQPDVQARLLDALGAIYVGLGLPDRAQTVLKDSMEARQSAGVVDSQPAARTMFMLAGSLYDRGQYSAAEPLARAAYEMTRRLVGPVNAQSAQTLTTLGMIYRATGRLDEAERMLLEATQVFRETLGPEHPMVSLGLLNTARVRRDRHDSAGAERLSREALEIQRRTFGSATGDSLSLLGGLLVEEGRADEAEAVLRESLAVRRIAYGKNPHPELEQALEQLATLLRSRGAEAEAVPLFQEAASLRAARTNRK